MRDLLVFLLDTPPLPDPRADWNGFLGAVAAVNAAHPQQWNPVTRRVTPWVDLRCLQQIYGPRGPMPTPTPFSAVPPQAMPTPQHPSFANRSTAPSQPMYSHSYGQQQQQQQQPYPAAQSSFRQAAPQPTPPPPPQPPSSGAAAQDPRGGAAGDTTLVIKKGVETQWATTPPDYKVLRPIDQLLGSGQRNLPAGVWSRTTRLL